MKQILHDERKIQNGEGRRSNVALYGRRGAMWDMWEERLILWRV